MSTFRPYYNNFGELCCRNAKNFEQSSLYGPQTQVQLPLGLLVCYKLTYFLSQYVHSIKCTSKTLQPMSAIAQMEVSQAQVHVRFFSNFDAQIAKVHRPTESFLRKVFSEYGFNILDVIVKDYYNHSTKHYQEGHGILTLATSQEACYICALCPSVTFESITVSCSLIHKNSSSSLCQPIPCFSNNY